MDTSAEANAAYVRQLISERGMTEPMIVLADKVLAGEPRPPAPWTYNYCLAYSDGHNNRGLSSKRLDHYACAYADICEEVGALTPDLEMTLDAFWLQWDEGATFEGSAGEHWHLA